MEVLYLTPRNSLGEKVVSYIHPRVPRQIQNYTIKKSLSNNMSLMADVPGKQPPLHIEAPPKLAKAWAKTSKWSGKTIWTWIKKINPQRKLNLSWMIFSFVPQRVCLEKSRKEGRFRRHADLFHLRDSSVFFHRNVPTAQSCSPFLSKLLGKNSVLLEAYLWVALLFARNVTGVFHI